VRYSRNHYLFSNTLSHFVIKTYSTTLLNKNPLNQLMFKFLVDSILWLVVLLIMNFETKPKKLKKTYLKTNTYFIDFSHQKVNIKVINIIFELLECLVNIVVLKFLPAFLQNFFLPKKSSNKNLGGSN
jgi:hypothetical protein